VSKTKKTPTGLYFDMIEDWFVFHEYNFKFRPSFSKVDGKQVKELQTFLTGLVKQKYGHAEDIKVREAWRIFLKAILKDQYIMKNATLRLINSQKNVIMRLAMEASGPGKYTRAMEQDLETIKNEGI
jgi:hypothetical protein